MLTLYVSGVMILLLGIQVLLVANYNIFADFPAMLVILFVLALCILVNKLYVLLGRCCRVWKVAEDENELGKKEEGKLIDIFKRLLV